jgi:beta-galactosidase
MSRYLNLDRRWQFRREGEGVREGQWETVDLPHSPFISDLDGQEHWLGVCRYRRQIDPGAPLAGCRCFLQFGAAMQAARLFVDGREIFYHEGGYLPFEVDVTEHLAAARGPCTIELQLDNRWDPDIPPGKKLDELDSCWYGGLYRDARLRIAPELHITDAVGAAVATGGGVFVRTMQASEERAVVRVRTHVRNAGPVPRRFELVVSLAGADHSEVAREVIQSCELKAGESRHFERDLSVSNPELWSPESPALHSAIVGIFAEDGLGDEVAATFGVRQIGFSRSGGFQINGRRMRLRGTNRLQEFPYVGYAAPRAAHFRDAVHIKEAGFDYVRLAHYPHSPHFLDACDQLGIVVMACIPGWQFMGGDRFREACFVNARQLIQRDRNHPCVVLWELSLNETEMDPAFMDRMREIGHEVYPGDQMFTCGWIDRYDVYIRSRQHGGLHCWANGEKALVVAEYGDWEYYAANEGFDQQASRGLLAEWSNSRKSRGDGEAGMRRQAWNHMVALNDTLASPAAFDGQWAMFDYARGYHPMRAKVGLMDVFRLPKFSYHFYRSQRDPSEHGSNWNGGPVVFIASHWTPDSDRRVFIFSNCDAVELKLNGVSLGTQTPARIWETQQLAHPPFVFQVAEEYASGDIEATGLIAGRAVARHRVSSPGAPSSLEIEVDDAEIAPEPGEPDLLFVHAAVRDVAGTLCVGDAQSVDFEIEGGGRLLGPSCIPAEAGVATAVVLVSADSPGFVVRASRGVMTAVWTAAGADSFPGLRVSPGISTISP